jgi:hypothetical protein
MVTTFCSCAKETMSSPNLRFRPHMKVQITSMNFKIDNYMGPIKSVHDKLVCSSNQLQAVCMIKLLRYILHKIT